MADIQTSAADKKEKEYFTATPTRSSGLLPEGLPSV